MNKIHFLFFLGVLFACSPSIQQLQRYKFVKRLSNSELQIPLTDQNKDILLLEQYGQQRKADRLRASTDKRNDERKAAFETEFTFCSYVFINEFAINHNQPYIIINESNIIRGDDGDETNVIRIEIWENNSLQITQEVTGSYSKNRLETGVRNLQKQLESLYSKATE